jgi:hypothetical protein
MSILLSINQFIAKYYHLLYYKGIFIPLPIVLILGPYLLWLAFKKEDFIYNL